MYDIRYIRFALVCQGSRHPAAVCGACKETVLSSNRVTLEGLRELGVKQVAFLPIDQLSLLLEEVAQAKADAAALDEKLHAAMSLRFADKAAAVRQSDGRDTGRARMEEGDFVVVADLPKAVVWDQAKLAQAEETVRSWGENVAEFITVKRGVAEAKYQAWPTTIRSVFDHARTVKPGKQSFAIEPKKGA